MKNTEVIDLDYKRPQGTLCGHSLVGPDVGTCPCCQKHKPLMVNGFCTSCNTAKGLNPLGYCPKEDQCSKE